MRVVHKIRDIVHLGLTSLTVHKVRSALTALGIIIGVCGVMASQAINDGMIRQSQKAFRERGTDNIVVNSKKPVAEDNQNAMSHVNSYGLTRGDVTRLATNIPNVVRCVAVHRTQKYAHVESSNLSVFVIGTEPSFQQVSRVEVTRGEFLRQEDMSQGKPVCLLTEDLADRLFKIDDPIGKTVRLGQTGDPFVVIGLLQRLPPALAGEGGDNTNCAIIPLSTDMARFGVINQFQTQGSRIRERVDVSQVILQMANEEAVVEGAAVARSLLKRYHEKMDFEVTVPLEQIRMMEEQTRLLKLVSLGIAAISLVVGGIGIMNIMLASVTERTREVGIRRALGAKRRDIVTQFLVESVALTMAGGIVGIAAGIALSMALERVLQFQLVITPLAIALPFFMAVVVGLVSGLYPAIRAAMLDPITALRHE